MTLQEIKSRISKEMKESGMNQSEIARKIKISQPSVSAIWREESAPALDTLAKLCVLLDVSADYILGIKDY